MSTPSRRRWLAATFTLATVLVTAVPAATASASDRITAKEPARKLYVTDSGEITNESTISIFTVGPDGGLTPFGAPVPTTSQARKIAFTPDGRTAYVVNGSDLVNQIEVFTVNDDGSLTRRTPVPADQFPFAMAVAPDGRTAYVSHTTAQTLVVYRIGADGSLTRLGESIKTGSGVPKGVAATPDGRFLYVSHGLPSDTERAVVVGFAINADGTLTQLPDEAQIGISGGAVTITPDGRFLYVANQVSNDVYGFSIRADGSLRPVPSSPTPAGDFTFGATVSPDGRHLYATSVGAVTGQKEGVWAYAIGGDGRLTTVTGSPFVDGDGPVGLAFAPDGRHLYVSNFNSSDVSTFEVAASGALTVAGPRLPTPGNGPAFDSATMLPNQGPVASFTVTVARAGQPTRFDATASSDKDGHIGRYDWDFGDGTRQDDAGPTPSHVYLRPGTYQVTLTVTDNEGCSTRLVYTGQTVLCGGSAAARHTRTIIVRGAGAGR